jgi:hypothetical protein
MSDYLDDVKHFADNHGGINGFADVLKDLKVVNSTGSYNKAMEGAAFMLRVLKQKSATFAGKITKFEGSIDDLTNGCRYDILFQNGGKATFGEFKSYASGSLSNFLSKGGDTYKQFLTYIGKIDDLDGLHYYFDAGKITDINLIKNRLKTVIGDNKTEFYGKLKPVFRQKYNIEDPTDLTTSKIEQIVDAITKLE